jgi:hypothetical protein
MSETLRMEERNVDEKGKGFEALSSCKVTRLDVTPTWRTPVTLNIGSFHDSDSFSSKASRAALTSEDILSNY